MAGYLGVKAGEIRFEYGPSGKPALRGEGRGESPSGLSFNLSHSEGFGLLAVTRGREVGVDVERVRPIADRESMAAMVLSARERAAYGEAPEERRDEVFLAYWTKKEALAKATGEGLGRPPEELEVVPFTEETVVLPRAREGLGSEEMVIYRIQPLRPDERHIGAVAVEGGGRVRPAHPDPNSASTLLRRGQGAGFP